MNNGGMVRKYIRTERQRRGWNQADLARAAGIKSKTTIVDLEAGRRLSEGYEGAVERALGWRIGSLDMIREGGEPIYAEQPRRYADTERQEIWDELGDYFPDDERAAIVEEVIRRRRGTGGAAATGS